MNGLLAGIPYLPFALLLPSGSIRSNFPYGVPRFCAMFSGSPPLPPSASVKYSRPYSGQPGVVICERLAEPHNLARRATIVGGGGRILRGPLEQHRIVCVHAAGGNEI